MNIGTDAAITETAMRLRMADLAVRSAIKMPELSRVETESLLREARHQIGLAGLALLAVKVEAHQEAAE